MVRSGAVNSNSNDSDNSSNNSDNSSSNNNIRSTMKHKMRPMSKEDLKVMQEKGLCEDAYGNFYYRGCFITHCYSTDLGGYHWYHIAGGRPYWTLKEAVEAVDATVEAVQKQIEEGGKQ